MIRSPCIRRCIYDYEKNHCTGCFRTQEDISNWWKLTEAEKRKVVRKAKKRSSEGIRLDEDAVLKTVA